MQSRVKDVSKPNGGCPPVTSSDVVLRASGWRQRSQDIQSDDWQGRAHTEHEKRSVEKTGKVGAVRDGEGSVNTFLLPTAAASWRALAAR
jgi:hypothetical protein